MIFFRVFYGEFVFFALIGSIGFLVDAAVLYGLKSYCGLYAARLVSFLTSVFVTWGLNRNLTFSNRTSGLSMSREFFAYLFLMMIGGCGNYAVYAALIFESNFMSDYPIIPLAFGCITGLFINYCSSKILIYKNK